MTLIYRTTGAWGSGSGANLTAAQVDGNFYTLAQAVAALQAVPSGVSIANIEQNGTTWTITMSNAATYSFAIPTAVQLPAAPIAVPGSALTPDLSHANTYLRCSNATGCAITLPHSDDVVFILGTEISFRQVGAGAITLAGAAGVTLHVPAGFLAETERVGATITAKLVDDDEWDVFGLLAVSP